MSDAPLTPNLFVIGAAKAASSSLQRWLGDHPRIGTSRIDETRFLMDAGDPLARPDGYAATGLAGYGAYFPPALRGGDCRHLIDVTPMYYYQRTARAVIPDIPDSRAIFLARRPSQRLKSLYTYAQNNISVLPKTVSFPQFVAEVEKGAGSQILGSYPMMRDALQHSRYIAYLADWQAALGPDRLKVLLFEDLVADPAAVLRDLAQWLEIDPAFYDGYGFPRKNETYTVRNQHLHRLARSVGRYLPKGMNRSFKGYYMRTNLRPGRPGLSDADSAAMARIDSLLAEETRALAAFLGRDTLWDMPAGGQTAFSTAHHA